MKKRQGKNKNNGIVSKHKGCSFDCRCHSWPVASGHTQVSCTLHGSYKQFRKWKQMAL